MEEGIKIKFSDIILINLISELVILPIISRPGAEWNLQTFNRIMSLIYKLLFSIFCSVQEVYEQGEPNWKENSECFWTKKGGSSKQSTV